MNLVSYPGPWLVMNQEGERFLEYVQLKQPASTGYIVLDLKFCTYVGIIKVARVKLYGDFRNQ